MPKLWTHSMKRGRPAMTMTRRRKQVLSELADCVASGERVTMAELARRCRLYDYRDARRIVRDLNRMGAVN
jgi:hypothetical protein